ncbi:glutamate receptor ionotropic, kainate glr-3-like [Palaemon carinicauda]|uniref:glutamate receptor ionotropic, kainate glr-3-like n=1 Tax=Palaemon carinicauda TaxID=392227 RepID=UPI0035B5B7ED
MKTLTEALEEPGVIEAMKKQINKFRFKEAPKLMVGAVHWPPHVTLQERIPGVTDTTGTYGGDKDVGDKFYVSGPIGNILNILAEGYNFTYVLTQPSDLSWGAKFNNGTWSGMVGQVHRKEADMALGSFGLTWSRFQVVDFSMSFYYDERCITARKGLPVIDPWGFLLPLSPTVWAGFAGALVLGWAAMLFSTSMPLATSFRRKTNLAPTLFFQHVRILLNQGIPKRFARRGYQRLIFGSWMLVVLMVLFSYTGNLVSLLALRYIPQPIQSIKKLISSRNGIIMQPNTIVTTAITNAESGELAELNRLHDYGLYKYSSALEFPKKLDTLVRRGDHVLLITSLESSLLMAKDFAKTGRCDFYKSKQKFLGTVHTMIGQKGSPLVPLINQKISQVVESGLYVYWLKNTIPFADACKTFPSKITIKEPLALSNLWGLFALIGIFYIPAFIAFLFERLLGNY